MRNVRGWAHWEAYANDQLGLQPTVASGSQFYDKGDGVDRSNGDWAYQADAKYTQTASYSIKARELDGWVTRARMSGKRFVLAVRIWNRGYAAPSDFAVLPFEDFKELLSKVREADADGE